MTEKELKMAHTMLECIRTIKDLRSDKAQLLLDVRKLQNEVKLFSISDVSTSATPCTICNNDEEISNGCKNCLTYPKFK